MTTPRARADVELLEKLVLGKLPVAEAERLAVEYADDGRVSELAEAVAGRDDTLIDSLRNHQTIDDPNADDLVRRLVQRLRGIAAPTGSEDRTSAPMPDGFTGQPPMPERLEYFQIQKILGEGGMGTVYLADDTRLQRQVALKTLRRELAVSPGAKERFLREARSAARLEHDHIVPIYYVGEADGIPFLAMPLLQGEPLETALQRGSADCPSAEAIRIARQIAAGLAAAHARGLIHRDIKPGNVWLEAPSRAREDPRLRPGPQPERADEPHRERRDPRHARVHGPGAGARLVGRSPGRPVQPRLRAVRDAHRRAAVHRPGHDGGLLSAGARHAQGPARGQPGLPGRSCRGSRCDCWRSKPDERPASAGEVVDALAKIEGAGGRHAERPRPASTPRPHGRVARRAPKAMPRKRRLLPLVAVGLLLALVGVGVLFGGTIFRVATNKGELVIEVDDKDVEVKIVQNGVVVQDKTAKREFTLTAGKGEIEVFERDGVKLATKKFELTRNGKTTVKVTLQELAEARKPKPKPKVEPRPAKGGDADRKAAEWVLSIGGSRPRERTGSQAIKAAADLPREPFRLTGVDLYEVSR